MNDHQESLTELGDGIRLISWRGLMKERIRAIDIKSPSDARKLGPFVDAIKKPLMWVNWSKPRINTGKKTKPYFRHYPYGRNTKFKYRTLDEELIEKKHFTESVLHRQAKNMIADYLKGLLKDGKQLEWSYVDRRASDFPLTGNLLSNVSSVITEYDYTTPFGIKYCFDIALLGRQLKKEPMILGAIELEKENRFGVLKCMISKALGFPLLSVNLDELQLENITDEWCRNVISETKMTSEDGLRRNYIYIHNLLYPVYINMPQEIRGGTKHQFIIFIHGDKIEELVTVLKSYKSFFGFRDDKVIHISRVNLNKAEKSSNSMIQNEGSIAGIDWEDYNKESYIRVSLDVPFEKAGSLYMFHLVMARLLNAHYETLVGYKYDRGRHNYEIDDPLWQRNHTRIIPKHLSEPIKPLIAHLKEFGLLQKQHA